jgi:hypothetical protein
MMLCTCTSAVFSCRLLRDAEDPSDLPIRPPRRDQRGDLLFRGVSATSPASTAEPAEPAASPPTAATLLASLIAASGIVRPACRAWS